MTIVAETQKIWRQEAGGLYKPTDLKFTIDAKGTVIFTLPKGGTIRDNGSEIHFSPQDEKAKSLAQKLAQAQWGLAGELNWQVLKRKPEPVPRLISKQKECSSVFPLAAETDMPSR